MSTPSTTCGICLEELRTRPTCPKHAFCEACVIAYAKGNLSTPTCPEPDCTETLPSSLLAAAVGGARAAQLLEFWSEAAGGSSAAPPDDVSHIDGLVELYTRTETHLPSASCTVHASAPASFFHYDCDGEADRGWGCTYRALQGVLSCLFQLPEAIELDTMPSLVDIQRRLVSIGSLPESAIKSREWIEPSHAKAFLDSYTSATRTFEYRVVPSNPADVLFSYFADASDSPHVPVIIDDAVFTYYIVAVAEDSAGKRYALRFDPHVRLSAASTPKGGQSTQDFINQQGQGVDWLDLSDSSIWNRRWMLLLAHARKPQ